MFNSNKFAIYIDSNERVPNLLNAIQELGLVERSFQQKFIELPVTKLLNKVLVFGKEVDSNGAYDFQIEKANPLIVDFLSTVFGKKSYKVSKNIDDIIDELYRFAGKEKKQKKDDMTINITISRPAAKKHKVRVFTNFVKVGWDQYSIKHDYYTGYEYVVIKGTRYEVVRDIFGKGYLVEL